MEMLSMNGNATDSEDDEDSDYNGRQLVRHEKGLKKRKYKKRKIHKECTYETDGSSGSDYDPFGFEKSLRSK